MLSLLLLLSCTDKTAPLDTAEEADADTDADTDSDTDADADEDTGDTGASSCPGDALTVGSIDYTGSTDPGTLIASASLSTGTVCDVVCDDPWFEVTIDADCAATGPTSYPVDLTAPSTLCLVLAVVPERDPAETACTVTHSPGTETVLDVVVSQ